MPARANLTSLAPRGKKVSTLWKRKACHRQAVRITGWRLHDLRRTIVSGLARLGIPPHVADKILNHQAGTISGVAAVYQRHDFLLSVRKRWIVGAFTSNTLCKNFVHQKTSNLQSQLQTKSVWPIPEELMKITTMTVLNQNRPHASPHPLRQSCGSQQVIY